VLENPALKRFTAELGGELIFAQVFIRRIGRGYELRHATDVAESPETLRLAADSGARALAQFTAEGQFRPLKSAPTLRRGWRILPAGDFELGAVLNQLYPGALADWLAAQTERPPVTNYREFFDRQSGMYRNAAALTDAQAAGVIQSCCAASACLKRRLWTIAELEPDAIGEKSVIPCLEPCAILMEMARKAHKACQKGLEELK
jgi:hypothetical protein